jgi:RNA polymerase sigma-70 factor (ECF subfamily)
MERMDDAESARRADEEARARWMKAAQAGDGGAYEALLVSLLPVLRAFVRRRGVDPGEVEDVVQEILLLIHRARHTWRPDRRFGPWMWAISRNATTDALRRQARESSRRERRAGHDEERAAGLERPRAADEGSDPEHALTSSELTPRLAEAVRSLPAAQRQAVELLYVEQLSVPEAAARAGVSPSALKVRAHRGSRALRAALRREEGS